MIIDNLKNANQYTNLHKHFKKAFHFLEETDLDRLEVGRYEIDGDNVFALIQAYDTKPWEDTNWETHAQYIDIQYILQGKERMGVCDASMLTLKENRLETNDIIFYEKEFEPFTDTVLSAGDFSIFFPTDAHRPCGCHQNPTPVKKIVIKVKH